MNSSVLLGTSMLLYIFLFVFNLTLVISKKGKAGPVLRWGALSALAVNFTGWILRWIESAKMGYGHPPLSNMYETLISLSWCIVLAYAIITFRYKILFPGLIIFPTVSIAMAFASFSPQISNQIEPLIPALQSNWLTYHVLTCFLAYAAFTISFASAIAFLIKGKKNGKETDSSKDMLPDADLLDEIVYRANTIGFLLLGVGIITGSVWAQYAWGRYWSWDPKETWSLITWIIYAIFLHARLRRGWIGRKSAILSILGFSSVLFTFLGVNYLLPGLHSYAT